MGKSIITGGNISAENVITEINILLSDNKYFKIFIIVDENTDKYCLPLLLDKIDKLKTASIIETESGEKNKNIHTCEKIWKNLSEQEAGRDSLIINLGGGVICDMGGFIASVYKRGIDFINIPTTLMAQIDASHGGKTGIDLNMNKNIIGNFSEAKEVFILTDFLKTLPERELISAFSEILKYALITDSGLWEKINKKKLEESLNSEEIIKQCIEIKQDIVRKDPKDQNVRKILNFGHTIGHAFESWSLKNDNKSLLHGEAVAIGIICESYLSNKLIGLDDEKLNKIIDLVKMNFKPYNFKKENTEELFKIMYNDKKNESGNINFTFIKDIGKSSFDNYCKRELVAESISFYINL